MASTHGALLLIDISNSFTKIGLVKGKKLEEVTRVPTSKLSEASIRDAIGDADFQTCVFCSVVPEKDAVVRNLCDGRHYQVTAKSDHGLAIELPEPSKLGADRIVNAALAAARYTPPVVVVDLGTAATFDVVLPGSQYVGGVIAPGLEAMTTYLHDRTALLPLIDLREPVGILGRNTEQAMLAGAVYGYRGLVSGILARIRSEVAPHGDLHVVATGGYASMLPDELPEVVPNLTLEGLLLIANRLSA